jgi:molybdopterin-guanine dinucleotide biosynthesis protein A
VKAATSARLLEACILAGGRSSRMGKDKSRLRLGGKSMLGHIRTAASEAGLPVRIIRRDAVRRCGPLGGIVTALRSTQAEAVLFLSCDMPFITPELLQRLLSKLSPGGKAVFTGNDQPGFPLVLRQTALIQVEELLAKGEFSLQALSRYLRAKRFRLRASEVSAGLNINTPAEYHTARRAWKAKRHQPTSLVSRAQRSRAA